MNAEKHRSERGKNSVVEHAGKRVAETWTLSGSNKLGRVASGNLTPYVISPERAPAEVSLQALKYF
jgi:hypothetical protein